MPNIFQQSQVENHARETIDAELAHGHPAVVARLRGERAFHYTPAGKPDQFAGERVQRFMELSHLAEEAKAAVAFNANSSTVWSALDRLLATVRALTLGNPGEDRAGKRADLEERIHVVIAALADVHRYSKGFLVPTATEPDLTAFRPASEFIDKRFPTYAAIHKVLKRIPSIRIVQRKGKHRLLIHAADWMAAVKTKPATTDPLDQPASTVDAVMGVEHRKALVDAERKQRRLK